MAGHDRGRLKNNHRLRGTIRVCYQNSHKGKEAGSIVVSVLRGFS